jgi:hypothetical protein
MRIWDRFFKKRTHDQTSADLHGCRGRDGNVEKPCTGLNPDATREEHERYDGREPMFMRKERTEPVRPGLELDDTQLPDGPGSPSPNRQARGALSFVLPDDRQAELMALCAQLDTHRSEVIRASLEMALPLFKTHHERFRTG